MIFRKDEKAFEKMNKKISINQKRKCHHEKFSGKPSKMEKKRKTMKTLQLSNYDQKTI